MLTWRTERQKIVSCQVVTTHIGLVQVMPPGIGRSSVVSTEPAGRRKKWSEKL